jgi:hypothetical protein
MSRLLNPNPGECVDRQTILILKVEAAKAAGIWAKPYADECTAIQKYLHENFLLLASKNLQDPYDRHYALLADINKRLWELEDNQRAALAYIKSQEVLKLDVQLDIKKYGVKAMLITELNDLRAQEVKEINTLFGIQANNNREKIYTTAAGS